MMIQKRSAQPAATSRNACGRAFCDVFRTILYLLLPDQRYPYNGAVRGWLTSKPYGTVALSTACKSRKGPTLSFAVSQHGDATLSLADGVFFANERDGSMKKSRMP